MDFTRINSAIDTNKTSRSKVLVVGAGGISGTIQHWAHSGVADFTLIDPDVVTPSNICRQQHYADRVGWAKVEAVEEMILRINPAACVRSLQRDFLEIGTDELDQIAGDRDLLIFATDRFAAQARGNELALRLGIAAIWSGIYAGGGAGEIAFWHSGLDACYRCLCASRYAAHAAAAAEGRSLDPISDGCTIFDVSLLDSITGMIGIGLLTKGSNNRFGRLISALGDRNFIQVKLGPDWTLGGRDIIRNLLGIPPNCPSYFAWNAIVRSDPDGGNLPCEDCRRYRGHDFIPIMGIPIRVKGAAMQASRSPEQKKQ